MKTDRKTRWEREKARTRSTGPQVRLKPRPLHFSHVAYSYLLTHWAKQAAESLSLPMRFKNAQLTKIYCKKKKNFCFDFLFLDFHSDQVFDSSPLCLQRNLLLHSFHYIQGCNKITEDSFKLYQWRGNNCKQLCSHAQRVQSDKYIS